MASFFYNTGMTEMLDGTIDIDTDTLKLMFVNGSYTADKDDLVVDAAGANDPIDHELSGTGYAAGWGGAGRKTAAITMQANNTNDRTDIAIDDLTWTAIDAGTIEGVILIKEGGANDTTSRLIAYFDVSQVTNGGNITLDFATLGAGGNMQVAN